MPILKIVDTEIINRDPIRELMLLYDIMNSSNYHQTITNNNDGIIPTKTSTVELTITNLTQERLTEIINTIEGLTLLSHRTSIKTPDEDMDVDTFNYNNYATDAFSYYNIRNEDYENYTQNANSEKILPNFCLGALWTRPGSNTSQEQINYYTMFNTIPSLSDSQILAGATPINNYEFDDEFLGNGQDFSIEDTVDYYKVMLNSGSVVRTAYQDANTHVYVDFNYNLNDSSQIGNTPFFNRIRLPVVDTPVIFTTNLTTPTINIDFLANTPSDIVRAFSEASMSEKLIKSFRNSNSFMRDFTINGQQTQLKVYDVMELFESIGYGGSLAEPDEMFLRDLNTNYAIDDNSPFTFYFYKLILLGKLRQAAKNKLKSFEQLIAFNEDHETEHVGFKVVKRIQGRTTPIQTFYFVNRRGLEDFIDTQIKFDRVYEYQIIGMFAIYGSNYNYENIDITSNNASNEAEELILSFDFVNRPSVKIAEVPLGNHTLRVVEPPPIVPEITFYNEMTSRNKLKIRMEHQDGNIVDEYMKKPLRPFGNNQTYINKLQQYFSSPNVLVTSGKTSDGVYEIYRLEEPPKSYRDFEGALIATVQSSVVYSNGEQSRNAMFVDMIKHQKKYYYAFRVLTHRGNPSELSPTYVAEMYEDADETFLTFNLYQEPEIKDDQNIYNMRKYIQILPNIEHTIVNQEELLRDHGTAQSALSSIKFGDGALEEKLWEFNNSEKYIKLRMESKSSGRKMDINLYFKIKKPTN